MGKTQGTRVVNADKIKPRQRRGKYFELSKQIVDLPEGKALIVNTTPDLDQDVLINRMSSLVNRLKNEHGLNWSVLRSRCGNVAIIACD